MVAAVVLVGLLLASGSAEASLLDGLVAYYPFSGDANDASAYANHGSVHGATLALDMFGGVARAYHFDGLQYIDAANPGLLLNGSALTIAGWVRLDQIIASSMQVVQKDSPDPDVWPHSFAMPILGTYGCPGSDCHSASRFGLALTIDGTYHNSAWSSAVLNAGQWYHLAATYDNSKVRLWLNGSIDSFFPLSGDFDNSDSALNIGRFAAQNRSFFQGTIDEVMIFDRALSAAEIQQLYQRYNVEDVPESATIWLLGAGLAGLAALRRRR